MAFTAGASSAHIGGALSIADIMSVLFVTKMRFKEKDPLLIIEIDLYLAKVTPV